MMREKINRKDQQAQNTRLKIVRAAVKLFARQGYHKTTINDLARAIGLTSGAIFYHFPNKEAVLGGVVDWLERGMHVYSDIADNAAQGSLAMVEEVLRVMCSHFSRNPEATICLAALATELAGAAHPMETRLKQIYKIFVDSLANRLKDNKNVTNPEAASIAFIGAVQGIAVQGLLRDGERTIDELAAGFLSMMNGW
ncbi:MAG: TetR/AcrR family transcriptional regulator [Syntrophobacteraceae bacterium]|nr:TetR/AcrR family transcriptional regulator [Syntrophobacteraceae bacterium]